MAVKSHSKKVNSNLALILIYVNIVLYATCFQIQRPLEPFLVEKLIGKDGSSSGEYARLQSFFSIMQTVGSLIAGRFLDNFGVKGGFIVSFLASAACYGILSQSTSLSLLYLSKVPTIFQAGFLCAQVAASQVTPDGAERVAALGRLTVSYTIGAVMGPTIGGYLGASGDYYLGAKIAVAGSLLSVVLTLFMPNVEKDEQDSPKEDKNADNESSGDSSSSMPTIANVIAIVWLFLSTKIITSVANAMAATAFPLILKNNYGMNEAGLGVTMSGMSLFNAVVNGLLLTPIVALTSGNLKALIGYCVLSMSLLSLLQAALALPHLAILPSSNGLYEYTALSFLLSGVQYVLSTTITSESTTLVGPKAKGTLLGLEHSLFAAARVFAPQAGIYLLDSGGVSAVTGACGGIFGVVFLAWHFLSENKSIVAAPLGSKSDGERKEK